MDWINKNIELPKENILVDILMVNGKRKINVTFDPKEEGINQFYKYVDKNFPEIKTCYLLTHWMLTPKPTKSQPKRKNRAYKEGRCPEENRDFGYSNEFWN